MMEDASMRAIEAADPGAALVSCFVAQERAQLLNTAGIGEVVVQQLEAAGVVSFERLRLLGVDGALKLVQQRHGDQALRNRRRALCRLFDAVVTT
jgi:voltage-gated potassium channel Kch